MLINILKVRKKGGFVNEESRKTNQRYLKLFIQPEQFTMAQISWSDGVLVFFKPTLQHSITPIEKVLEKKPQMIT
jgi:hypothetical protein